MLFIDWNSYKLVKYKGLNNIPRIGGYYNSHLCGHIYNYNNNVGIAQKGTLGHLSGHPESHMS